MKKITNWNNYTPSKGEENSGELLVIPDQAYTIPEIFEKFRRGITLPLEREVSYSDTDDFDDVDLRTIVKDPYDVDEELVRRRITKKQRKGVILGDGLPDSEPFKKAQEEGVKDTGNNSESNASK